MKTHRQIVKAKDIQIFFGKSQAMSNKMLRTMRKALKKEKYQPITIIDFCTFYKTDKESLIKIIISIDHKTAPKCCIEIERTESVEPVKTTIQNKSEQPYKFAEKTWRNQIE